MSQSTEVSIDSRNQFDTAIDSLWRFFSNTKVGLVLILVVAFVSLLGSLIPQAPQQYLSSPDEYLHWLDTIRPKYGLLTDVYSALGMFNLYYVLWFKVLLLVLVFSTTICTLNRLPSILLVLKTPKVKMGDSLFKNSKVRASFKPKNTSGRTGAAESLIRELSKKSYKVFVEEDGDTKYIFADRFGIFKLGTLATHTSIVVLLIGAVLGGMFGNVDEGAVLPEGKTYDVAKAGFGEYFLVRADKFVAEYWEDGRPKDYYSDLTVIDAGKEVLKKTIRVNDPLEYRGVRFHQAFYGSAATLEVKDDKGVVVFSDDLALSSSYGSTSVGFTRLRGTDLFLIASLSSSSGSEQLGIEIDRGDIPIASSSVKRGASQNVGGYDVGFKEMKQFTGLRVVKDPGVPVVWLASAMLVIGVCVTLYFPQRRIWARVSPREVSLAGTADRMVNLQQELNQLADEVGGKVETNRKRGG